MLDPEEQREIELAENLDRKDLTPLERSRNVVALAEAAAEVLRHEPAFSSESEEKSRRGRPQKPDTTEKVAARIGIPETTLHEAKQHVATAEAYPALQKPDWKQYSELAEQPQSVAIAAALAVTALPQEECELLPSRDHKPRLEGRNRHVHSAAVADHRGHAALGCVVCRSLWHPQSLPYFGDGQEFTTTCWLWLHCQTSSSGRWVRGSGVVHQACHGHHLGPTISAGKE